MKTIEVNKDNVLKAFNHFNQKITDRIKTFEDACEALKFNDCTLSVATPSGSKIKRDVVSLAAYLKLTIIARALNEGWEPNWADSNEYKYYPWMKYEAGSGFSDSCCGGSATYTSVSSRLCFKTRELAEYAATQFKDIYNDFLTL